HAEKISIYYISVFFFFQAEDGIRDFHVTGVQTCALPIFDPACERQFGVPAADLCALIGSPYASLMEPEARYKLHDDIQLQLAQRSEERRVGKECRSWGWT